MAHNIGGIACNTLNGFVRPPANAVAAVDRQGQDGEIIAVGPSNGSRGVIKTRHLFESQDEVSALLTSCAGLHGDRVNVETGPVSFPVYVLGHNVVESRACHSGEFSWRVIIEWAVISATPAESGN